MTTFLLRELTKLRLKKDLKKEEIPTQIKYLSKESKLTNKYFLIRVNVLEILFFGGLPRSKLEEGGLFP